MTYLNKSICLLAAVFALSGCSHRAGSLTLVSTRDIDLSSHLNLKVSASQRVIGEDCHYYLLGLPPIWGHPDLAAAVEKALHKGQGNIMVNEVTDFSDVWIVIGRIRCISATGNVVNVPLKPL